MTVVIEDENGKITVLCKGAESIVTPLCTSGPIEETLQHVSDFAHVRQHQFNHFSLNSNVEF
jgi:magnesium-transporting ATPase (P-type)